MDYDYFLSRIGRNRKPDVIREMVGIMKDASPEVVFLAGGLPNPDIFPIKGCSIQLEDGETISLEGDALKLALQYTPTSGFPALFEQLNTLTKRIHAPPKWDHTDILVCNGAQYAMSIAFSLVLNMGDHVIIQEPCFSGALSLLTIYKPKYITVETDSLGMKPTALLQALEPWKNQTKDANYKGPKVIYVIPNADNPTGVSLDEERKREIYKIASEYNLLIFEDDPYYFLQFAEKFAPSFLNLDVDGRVIRFDSFSKVFSPGIRLGWATGPKPLIQKMNYDAQTSILHTPALTQAIVSEILRKWGEENFEKHVRKLQRFYKEKRDVMLMAAEKHLSGLCEWSIPTGGMFLWMKVPQLKDTWEMILQRALKKNVMLVPGRAFFNDQRAEPSNHLRASFSFVSSKDIERGILSLKELIEEEIRLKK